MEAIELLFLPCIGSPGLAAIVLSTQAWYTRSLVLSVRLGLFQDLCFSWAMTVAALAILLLISESMVNELEIVDPRYVKLSTTSKGYRSMTILGGVSAP